jgi:hypothetical protein
MFTFIIGLYKFISYHTEHATAETIVEINQLILQRQIRCVLYDTTHINTLRGRNVERHVTAGGI